MVELKGFLYYSYCRNPSGWEFIVPTRTLIGIFLLKVAKPLELRKGLLTQGLVVRYTYLLLVLWYTYIPTYYPVSVCNPIT